MTTRLAFIVLSLLLAQPVVAHAQSPVWNGQGLAADHRAVRVGDSLTVLIVEASSASTTAQSGAQRQSRAGGRLGNDSLATTPSAMLESTYDGRGQLVRSGRLIGQIGVVVESVYPNGDLWVRGRQVIDIDGEVTTIELAGRARPSDIGGDNTILSSRLADAEILYDGEGSVSRSGSPGLLQRMLSWLGLP